MELTLGIEFIAMVGIVILGCAVGTATGFGSSTIIMTFAVLLFPIKAVVPVVITLNLVICTYLVVKHYKGINKRLLFAQILPLTLLGMPVGVFVFNIANTEQMKPYFGAFVILLSLFELYRHTLKESNIKPPNILSSVFWLGSGGLVQGLWVTGGPPIAYWASKAMKDKTEFRSTLSALWLILNIILFISHFGTSSISIGTTITSLYLVAPLFIGIFIGEKIHNHLPEKLFRILVYFVLLFSGTAILLDGIR